MRIDLRILVDTSINLFGCSREPSANLCGSSFLVRLSATYPSPRTKRKTRPDSVLIRRSSSCMESLHELPSVMLDLLASCRLLMWQCNNCIHSSSSPSSSQLTTDSSCHQQCPNASRAKPSSSLVLHPASENPQH